MPSLRLVFRLSLLALLLWAQALPVNAALSIQHPLQLGDAPHYEAAPHVFYLADPGHRLGIADIAQALQLDRFHPLANVDGETNWRYSGI